VHHRAGPQGGVYERLTLREQKISDIETAKFIEEGKEDIPQPDKLGGTIGVSCDMCHPHAANTFRKIARSTRPSCSAWPCCAT
jgi:hypothetical protein